MSPLAFVSPGMAIRRTVSSPRGSSSTDGDLFIAIAPFRNWSPRGLRRHDALDAGEVPPGCAVKKACSGRNCKDGVRLPRADFDQKAAVRRNELGRGRNDRPVGFQPVGAAVEGKPRIEIAHFEGETGDIRARDIGRIRDDQVERPRDAVRPIADANLGASGEAAGLEVGAGDPTCVFRPVDAEPLRSGELAEQRTKERARAGPEIEDAQRPAPPAGEQRDGRLDDRLRFGPRIEHVPRYGERKTPKLALADDFRQRLSSCAPEDILAKQRRCEAERRIGNGDDGRRREPAGRTERQTRFARRLFEFGAEDLDKLAKRFGASRRRAEALAFAQATCPWQCLNFLPDPHGQDSFRPTFPQVAGFFGSRSATATPDIAAVRPTAIGSLTAPNGYSFSPVAGSRCWNCIGGGGSGSWKRTSTRDIWAITASCHCAINCWKSSNASDLYSLSGSRWAMPRQPITCRRWSSVTRWLRHR